MAVGGAIAFDLDMTLVDSRPVSRRALERLADEHGAELDIEMLMSAYGLPLSDWLPPQVDGSLFRTLQSRELSRAVLMPGALAAAGAAREAATRVVVVTSSSSEIASGMLASTGLSVDRVWADVWGRGKVKPLREERCWAFVGDHAADMSAARDAGAIAVGVGTGTTRPLGAEIELEDLTAFPAWLARRDE